MVIIIVNECLHRFKLDMIIVTKTKLSEDNQEFQAK